MISPWWSVALTTVSLATMVIAGRKRWQGWALGLAGQAIWVTYAVVTAQYAFVVSAVLHGAVYATNMRKWIHDDANRGAERISARP